MSHTLSQSYMTAVLPLSAPGSVPAEAAGAGAAAAAGAGAGAGWPTRRTEEAKRRQRLMKASWRWMATGWPVVDKAKSSWSGDSVSTTSTVCGEGRDIRSGESFDIAVSHSMVR